MRRRARHRLIGASVLVLLGVVGFPLLFDTQPRPISVDIPIEIPAKSTPAPTVKSPATASAAPPAAAKPPTPNVETREALSAREEVVEATAPPKPAVETAKTAPVPVPAPADAERARALLEGKTVTPPSTTAAAAPATAVAERLVVQVGAFSEEAGARSVRQKLEAAGLKTYTQVAETSEGRRIRVRLGPYNSRAEADKAAVRVKALGLPAAVLTL